MVFNILKKVFPIVAVILIAVTAILLVNMRNKLNNSFECTGVIIGFDKNNSVVNQSDGISYAISPIIRYSVNGEFYETIGNFYSTSMKEGDEVLILCNNEDYSRISLKKGVYLAPIIVGSLAVFFTVFSIILLFTI